MKESNRFYLGFYVVEKKKIEGRENNTYIPYSVYFLSFPNAILPRRNEYFVLGTFQLRGGTGMRYLIGSLN